MAEEQKERPTVRVGCRVPNGIELHIMRRRDDAHAVDGVTGTAANIEDKGFIKLAGPKAGSGLAEAFTPVDKELWELWLLENGEHGLVKGGTVFVQEPEPQPEVQPRGDKVRTGDSPADPEPEADPEPTDVHDETFRDNFKDPAGQEGGEPPTLRGKSKDEVDAGGKPAEAAKK